MTNGKLKAKEAELFTLENYLNFLSFLDNQIKEAREIAKEEDDTTLEREQQSVDKIINEHHKHLNNKIVELRRSIKLGRKNRIII